MCDVHYDLTTNQLCQVSTVVIYGDDFLSAIWLIDGNLLYNDGCSSECLI
jgi:hypothetical protein